MVKRHAEDSIQDDLSRKRLKPTPSSHDRLSRLSDELLLRILSFVPYYDLTVCQRVSHRIHRIAGDSQLWKSAYYERFVLPRVLHLPKAKGGRAETSATHPPSKASTWLDDDVAVKRGIGTNWKRQFKLRHKWSNGTCKIKDIPVSAPPVLPVLARLHDGVVYTIDSNEGFRAWSYKDDRNLLASKALESSSPSPSSLAVDLSNHFQNTQLLATGFTDGSFTVHSYSKENQVFKHVYSHTNSSNGRIYAMAFSWPYILTLSATQTLSLYSFEERSLDEGSPEHLNSPRLLTSLASHTTRSPLSLSLRIRGSQIVAAIAYCIPTYTSGWSAGVQEIHLTQAGEILDSRLATSHSRSFNPLSISSLGDSLPQAPVEVLHQLSNRSNFSSSKPTSLSYAHPYLLVGHSDNTLTLYMVTSNARSLTIGAGKRLWGHTSSVFDAHVGSRGKAVSVSSRGSEVRIWELERSNFIGSCRTEAGAGTQTLSVQISPERIPAPSSLLGVTPEAAVTAGKTSRGSMALLQNETLEVTRAWVGFDDENVVVLREQGQGRQALDIYDFS